MFEMTYIPDYQGNKLTVVHSDTHTPVGANNIQISIQSDVDLNRQTEIFEGLRQNWDHMRDNNMLSSPSGPLYVARNIDTPKSGIRQLVDLSGVEDVDIVIGVGASVNANGSGEEMAVNMLETAFKQLREYAKENFFKSI